MHVLLQTKHISKMQLSDLQQETVSNHTLSTRMRLRITQHQEFQNHHESSESEILHDCMMIIRTTDMMSRYSEQIQFHNHLSIRKRRNNVQYTFLMWTKHAQWNQQQTITISQNAISEAQDIQKHRQQNDHDCISTDKKSDLTTSEI